MSYGVPLLLAVRTHAPLPLLEAVAEACKVPGARPAGCNEIESNSTALGVAMAHAGLLEHSARCSLYP